MGHTAILCTKPVITQMNDMPSHLVRLGHLHESGKVTAEHMAALEKIVNSRFEFEAVSAFPPEYEMHHNEARRILRVSRPTMDLGEEDEQFILAIDNWDWGKSKWKHIPRPEFSFRIKYFAPGMNMLYNGV